MLCSICKREITVDPANLGGTLLCQSCADTLAHAAPRLLVACTEAADLLGRLWTPNAPTVAELALVRGKLEAVIVAVTGGEVVADAAESTATDSEEESWPDTSIGSRLPR